MKQNPIEYIWLCQKHYEEKCKEVGYEIPILLIENMAHWTCKECDEIAEHLIYNYKRMVINKWD